MIESLEESTIGSQNKPQTHYLKNCACCNAPAYMSSTKLMFFTAYRIGCSRCGLGSGTFDTEKLAREVWNLRIPKDNDIQELEAHKEKLLERIEHLKVALRKYANRSK